MSWKNNNGRDRTATGGIVWHPVEVPESKVEEPKPGLICCGDIEYTGDEPVTSQLPGDISCCQRGIVFNEAVFTVNNSVGGAGVGYSYIDSLDACYNYSARGLTPGYKYMVATDPINHFDLSRVVAFEVCDDISGPWIRLRIDDPSDIEINARRIDMSGDVDISGNVDISNSGALTTFTVRGLANSTDPNILRYDVTTGNVTYGTLTTLGVSGLDIDCSNIIDVSRIDFCEDVFLRTKASTDSVRIGYYDPIQGTPVNGIGIGNAAGEDKSGITGLLPSETRLDEAGISTQGAQAVAIGADAGWQLVRQTARV